MEGEHLINGLRRKRREIETEIERIRQALVTAQSNLDVIDGALRLCGEEPASYKTRVHSGYAMLFKRGELQRLTIEALRDGPKSAYDIAAHIFGRKGWIADEALLRDVRNRVGRSLRRTPGRTVSNSPGPKGEPVWRLVGDPR
jgi:hypothetical protein